MQPLATKRKRGPANPRVWQSAAARSLLAWRRTPSGIICDGGAELAEVNGTSTNSVASYHVPAAAGEERCWQRVQRPNIARSDRVADGPVPAQDWVSRPLMTCCLGSRQSGESLEIGRWRACLDDERDSLSGYGRRQGPSSSLLHGHGDRLGTQRRLHGITARKGGFDFLGGRPNSRTVQVNCGRWGARKGGRPGRGV